MIKQLNKTVKKLALTLGAAGLVASMGLQSSVVKADTTSDQTVKATYDQKMDQDLKDHKNLQAYRNPLVAASLVTSLNQLPEAQAGVSNWDSLPAGTTAKWNMEPDVSKTGRSYGQIIVTFPDGSASNLAVYVTTKDNAASDTEPDSTQSPVAAEDNDSQTSENSSKTDGFSVQSPVIVRDAKNAQSSENSNSTTDANVATPKSEGAVVTDETAHVAGDNELPQTNAKNTLAMITAGMVAIIASLGLIAKNLIKERN